MVLPLFRLQWSCIFLLLLFVVSCSWKLALKEPEGEQGFFQEISRLEKIAREHPDPSVRAQAHLQLSFLFLNHRNPQVNYPRALQEMKNYLSMAPDEAAADDLQNWLAVLQEMEHLRKSGWEKRKENQSLQAEIEKLHPALEKMQRANKILRDEVAGLKEMNAKMKETIERLESLDLQIEEKRKNIR